ncbi:hypothetical protein BDV97DRAFT_135804 [Delphinella strobiligena]|nr:hypothetical protein BDV97DRAFT_135804 [Delphinella strobiligena]
MRCYRVSSKPTARRGWTLAFSNDTRTHEGLYTEAVLYTLIPATLLHSTHTTHSFRRNLPSLSLSSLPSLHHYPRSSTTEMIPLQPTTPTPADIDKPLPPFAQDHIPRTAAAPPPPPPPPPRRSNTNFISTSTSTSNHKAQMSVIEAQISAHETKQQRKILGLRLKYWLAVLIFLFGLCLAVVIMLIVIYA